MTLPKDQALFSTAEVCKLLSLSQSSVRRLIEEGQLEKVYPRPRAMRVTRESLERHIAKATSAAAVRASIEQQAAAKEQAARVAAQVQEQQQKKSLADRWGLGALFGKVGG